MATRQEHIDQAKSNEKTANALEKDHPAWAVTAYFYAALHWVEAYLVSTGQGSERHDDRRAKMVASAPMRQYVLRDYDKLQGLSRRVRYDAQPIRPEDVQRAASLFAGVKTGLGKFTGWK